MVQSADIAAWGVPRPAPTVQTINFNIFYKVCMSGSYSFSSESSVPRIL